MKCHFILCNIRKTPPQFVRSPKKFKKIHAKVLPVVHTTAFFYIVKMSPIAIHETVYSFKGPHDGKTTVAIAFEIAA